LTGGGFIRRRRRGVDDGERLEKNHQYHLPERTGKMKLGAFATTRDEAFCVCNKEYLFTEKK
jgi:hypothetical protein